MSNRFEMLLPSLCALLCLLPATLIAQPAGDDAAEQSIVLNTAHLESLQEVVTVKGQRCRIVHIYCEAPDYEWVGDDDEGIACVDDVARAARFYLNEYDRHRRIEDLRVAVEMLEFVLVMQADNGEFYNFIWPDYTINTEHKNSRATLGWWAARGFRSLALGRRVLDGYDDDFTERLDRACSLTIRRLHQMYLTAPDSMAGLIAPDVAAVWTLGLLEWREVHPSDDLDEFIAQIAGTIFAKWGSDGWYPGTVHPAWRNVWHAWGALMVQARLRAGQAFEQEEWLKRALQEAYGLHRYQVNTRFLSEFRIELLDRGNLVGFDDEQPARILRSGEISQVDGVKEFPQIAYGIGSLVACQRAAYDFLRESGREPLWGEVEDVAVFAGLAASWLRGNNAAGRPMYDPETGRTWDGLISETEINYNSGAESTIEGLLMLQAIRGLPLAVEAYFTDRQDPAFYESGPGFLNEKTGAVFKLRSHPIGGGQIPRVRLEVERP